MSQRFEFRVLGPFEVRRDGRVVELPAGKPRALLAALLLQANEVVSVDRLVVELWGEDAPATAAKNIRVYVSRLRKLLGEGVLVTRAPGYVLRAAGSLVDADQFRLLVQEAHHEQAEAAAGKLRRALALWRGPALVDFSYDSFAQDEIRRLEELRLAALEDRIEADLSLGHEGDLVGELEALVGAQPLRERLRGQLMVALFRCGRQAEALEVYRAGRRRFVDELGLEPGPALQQLERAILEQDQALERTRTGMAASHEVRKAVTILVAELILSTTRTLDPESLRKLTQRYFDVARHALERHEASVQELIGSSVIGIFGTPRVHEDDALRAIRAGADLQKELRLLNDDLEGDFGVKVGVSIGIDTGEVVAGEGSRARTVTGEAVAIASRLAQLAASGEVLLGESAFKVVSAWIRAERLEPLRPKASGEPVSVTRVLELLTDPSPRRWLDVPMVGRARERRLLDDAFERVVTGQACQLFTLYGTAGVGKSRLASEFFRGLGERAAVVHGRSLPYGEGITYWPVAEVLQELAGIDVSEPPAQARQKLRLLLEDAEDAELIEARVAEVIGLAEATAGSSEDGFWGVRKLFETCARGRPLVVMFDDLHWAEPTFLDLVENLVDWALDAPILVLCLSRPELLDVRPGWGGGKLNASSVSLVPLDDAEGQRLIENLLEWSPIDPVATSRIIEAGDGNPLFIEETLAMLIDDGLLRREDGEWHAIGDIGSFPIPPTVQALLAARLDRLPQTERAVLERASVEGMIFHQGSVEQLGPETSHADVEADLMNLARRELIRPERTSFPGENAFRFRHVLIRNAAYEAIPKELRSGLHERFAEWLEHQAGGRTPEEIVGHHLEQAYHFRAELGERDAALAERAAERLAAAGYTALNRGDYRAGGTLLGRAIELLPERHPFRLELLPPFLIALPAGDEAASVAVRELQTSDDRRAQAYGSFLGPEVRLFSGEGSLKAMAAAAQSARTLFAQLDDERGLAYSERALAQVSWIECRTSEAADAFERARVHAEAAGLPHLVDECLTLLALQFFNGPMPIKQTIDRCKQLLESARGRVLTQAALSLTLGALHSMQGETRRARELIRPAAELLREAGQPSLTQISFVFAADVEEHAHNPKRAERLLREGMEELDRLADQAWSSTVTMLLANLLARQGRNDDAQTMLQRARARSSPDDIINLGGLAACEALLLARQGRYTDAERTARAAVATAETTDMPWLRGTAAEHLAAVLELAARPEDARAELERSLTIYEARGDVPCSIRVRETLAELGKASTKTRS